MSGIEVRLADPADPSVAELVARHIAASRAHYDVEDCHALDGDALVQSGTRLHAAWLDGHAVGIGGYKALTSEAVELKSMHTADQMRGRGVAGALLEHLMASARAEGFRRMLLEAGTDAYAAPARALYERAGFVRCPPFGSYSARQASVFMARDL